MCLNQYFPLRARQWQLQDLSLFPFPPAPQQTLKKQLSLDFEFHNFDWLGLAGSFSKAGLYREPTSQGGFYPLLPHLPAFHIYGIVGLLTLRNSGKTLQTHKWRWQWSAHEQGRNPIPPVPQTGSLWSLRSTRCSLTGQGSHGSHTQQPGGCDRAGPSLERASSPFLPVHSPPLAHRCGCPDLLEWWTNPWPAQPMHIHTDGKNNEG